MEVLERVPTTNRITLRLPNQVLEILKTEAEKKDLPLNALITKILYKNISFDLHVKAMPNITIPHDLFINFIDKIDDSFVEDIAKAGPTTVKKLFKILGINYDLDQIIYNYFDMIGKYCEWYQFSHQAKHDKYRLVFNSTLGPKWTKFLAMYVRSILESLKIRIDEMSINDGLVVFEFSHR
ncbi:MAG TPA: hypothetical protein VLB45_04855 [Nitrosopumilaceae archaeon]|nr:hypothetical protein [Nitrosopumilaceae archaeon]